MQGGGVPFDFQVRWTLTGIFNNETWSRNEGIVNGVLDFFYQVDVDEIIQTYEAPNLKGVPFSWCQIKAVVVSNKFCLTSVKLFFTVPDISF